MAVAEILVVQDLFNRVGADKIRQYFDDSGDASLVDDDPQLQSVMASAEGLYFAHMLKAGYDRQALIDLANADETIKEHIAWIAVELASERRPAFTAADGSGAHIVQYDRAVAIFTKMSKARLRSGGEATVGRNAHVGGNVQPAPPSGTAGDFVFAPSKNAPTGRGGF